MNTAWIYLIVGGIFEWGWPIGMKLAVAPGRFRVFAWALAIVCMVLSGLFLYLAQRSIPVGTAYAIWTGIGTVGTFGLGMLFLHEPVEFTRFLLVGLIVAGIIGLRLTSSAQ